MIEPFEISATKLKLDDKLKKYTTKKLANLDRYLSRHTRRSAQMEVRLSGHKSEGQSQNVCHVVLRLPGQIIRLSEEAGNIYAAVDITQTKLKNQLKKYKESHTDSKRRRHLFARGASS